MDELGKVRWVPEIVGSAVVTAATAAAVMLFTYVQVLDSPWLTGLIAEPILLAIALYAWHLSAKGREAGAEEWMAGTIFTPLLGAMSFAVDVFTGSMHGNYNNFFQTAFHAGSPFGIVLTVMICPIATIVCMGGWVRCFLIERSGEARNVDD